MRKALSFPSFGQYHAMLVGSCGALAVSQPTYRFLDAESAQMPMACGTQNAGKQRPFSMSSLWQLKIILPKNRASLLSAKSEPLSLICWIFDPPTNPKHLQACMHTYTYEAYTYTRTMYMIDIPSSKCLLSGALHVGCVNDMMLAPVNFKYLLEKF